MSIHFAYWQFTPLLIPLFLALLLCSAVISYSLRQRTQPLAHALLWATILCGWWVFARLMAYATIDLTIKHYWHKAEYLGVVSLPVATLVFALHYGGLGHWVTRRRLLFAAIIPAISLTLLLTTELHGLMWRERPLIDTPWGLMPYSIYGPWFWIHTLYSYTCTLVGSAMILIHLWQSPPAYRWQALNIVLAVLTPIAINMLFITKLLPLWLDVTPGAFAVTMSLMAWDIYYLHLFDVVPIARRVILDMIGDGVIVLTHDGRIADINPAAASIFGVKAKSCLGSRIDESFPSLREIFATTQNTKSWVEFMLDHAKGGPRWYKLQTRSVKFHQGATAGWVIVLHDITEQKANEHALSEARDEALAADRLKTQLLGKVSHELRTPISVILSYAEIIQRQSTLQNAEKQQAAATTIINYGRHLNRLVNDLLDTAQLESGKMMLKNTLFSLEELLEHVIDQNAAQASTKQIVVSHNIDPRVPAMLVGDTDRLLQILNNLVGNAIKFTDHGSVQINVYRPSEWQWAIQVVDTGPGIPAEAHTKIFEPFQQLGNGIAARSSGYGLGLTIVHQLAKLMHGEVVVDSEMGRGSVFTILLPLDPSSSPQA